MRRLIAVIVLYCAVVGETAVFAIPLFACRILPSMTSAAEFLKMDADLPAGVAIRQDERNGTVIFLKGDNLSVTLEEHKDFQQLQASNQYEVIVLAFLNAHRSVFRVDHPSQELTVKSVTTDDLGLRHIRLQQVYRSIPVWASEINVHLDRANHVYLVQGRYIPTPGGLNVQPALTRERSLQLVAKDLGRSESDCPRCRADLIIFALSDSPPRLAYRVLAQPRLTEGWAYVIDAETGSILDKISTIYTDKHN
jgi:Zn-dependent metalloprotease